MKYSLVALAATSIFGGASARSHLNRRHNHPFPNNGTASTCIPQCTTYVTSYLVDYTPPPHYVPNTVSVVPVPDHTTTTVSEEVPSYSTTAVTETYQPTATPEVTTCPTPGTYTIPEKTITLTSTEYICVPTTTQLPPGEHTYGGVTTIVETATTITCPIPTVETTGDVTTSKVILTTYVCPTPGTYTINPITTTLTVTEDCEYPEVTEYPPGTYTHPEVTTTITKTNEVVTCPLYTTTKTMEVVPIPPTTAPEPPKETYPEPDVTEDEPEPEEEEEEEDEGDFEPYVPRGDLWAITYSPYTDDGQCKAAGDVDADIKDIASKGFKSIRLYSSECNGLETVGGACAKHGLKIVIGVFIKAGGVTTADSQVTDIIEWGKWDLVEMFVVGNEAIFQGFCNADELAAYIRKVTGQLREGGYNGPVTTTEPLNIYEANYKTLCSCIDVVGVNIHPFFNPTVTSDNAGNFLSGQLKIAEDLCGKTGYVLEAGWPSSGEPNGAAIPSVEDQQIAVKSIEEAEPGRVCIFTYRNDLWKQPGAFGVEQNFGCAQLF